MFLWIGEINTSFDIALSTISDTTNEIYESFTEFNSFSHSVPVADRYADRVILNPENLLGLKIGGFKYDSQLRCIQRETAEFEVSDVYSVLAKLKNTTKTIGWSYECVGDFSTYSAAKEYMKSLMTRYSLSPSSCTDTIAN